MKAFCIADEDTVRGFRLAGVAGEAVSNAREAADALARVRSLPDCALLILGETICADLGAPLAAWRATCDRPVVVELPLAGEPTQGRRGLDRLVRSVLGAHLEDEP